MNVIAAVSVIRKLNAREIKGTVNYVGTHDAQLIDCVQRAALVPFG